MLLIYKNAVYRLVNGGVTDHQTPQIAEKGSIMHYTAVY